MFVENYSLNMSPGELARLDINFVLKPEEVREGLVEALTTTIRTGLDLELVEKKNMQEKIIKDRWPDTTLMKEPTISMDYNNISINTGLSDLIREKISSGSLQPHHFIKEYPVDYMSTSVTPHSKRTAEGKNGRLTGEVVVSVTGRELSGKAYLTDENIEVRIPVPGIPRENIKVKRVNNIIRVFITGEDGEPIYDIGYNGCTKFLEYFLDENETVTEVDLELGMLTIYIDRDAVVEDWSL